MPDWLLSQPDRRRVSLVACLSQQDCCRLVLPAARCGAGIRLGPGVLPVELVAGWVLSRPLRQARMATSGQAPLLHLPLRRPSLPRRPLSRWAGVLAVPLAEDRRESGAGSPRRPRPASPSGPGLADW